MTEERCWCRRCTGADYPYMIVCPVCGDKRCVRAADHQAPCAQDDIYAHNAWVQKRLDTAIAETREECAQVCDLTAAKDDTDWYTACECAAAIRAKG